MNTPMIDARRIYDLLYIPLKLVTAATLLSFAWRILSEFKATGNWLLLGVLLGEAIVIVLVLIAPRPSRVTLTPAAMIFTVAATTYFMVVSVKPAPPWVHPLVPAFFILAGIALQVVAKLALGRSFGLLPALRTVKRHGPYRVVRHPIYAGYLCTHVGFFLVATSLHNLVVFAILYACQVMRILEEERILSTDPSYAQYMKEVRWRLVPGLF